MCDGHTSGDGGRLAHLDSRVVRHVTVHVPEEDGGAGAAEEDKHVYARTPASGAILIRHEFKEVELRNIFYAS